jgi:phosphatidylglycerophosphate synthase
MTEGERWTASELDKLRAGGYTPAAWGRFLRASLTRAADTRRRRPGLARQANRWSLFWLLAAGASRARPLRTFLPRVPWRREALWWLSSSAMVRWHLGMVESRAGEQRERLSAADALTLARLWLSPRVARSGWDRRRFRALLAAGCVSDLLDGRLARRRGATRLGRDLDPIADVCFYGSATAAARRAGLVSAAASGIVGLRYVAAVSYVSWSYFGAASRPPAARLGPENAAAALLPTGLTLAAAGRRRAGSGLVAGGSLTVLVLQALSHMGKRQPASAANAVRTARGGLPPRRRDQTVHDT